MDIEKFKNIIQEVCDIPINSINEDSKLSDLGLDSLEIAQVIFTVEGELNITIDGDNFENIVTVGDALRAIQEAE